MVMNIDFHWIETLVGIILGGSAAYFLLSNRLTKVETELKSFKDTICAQIADLKKQHKEDLDRWHDMYQDVLTKMIENLPEAIGKGLKK